MYLEKINSPEDLKKLSGQELVELSKETRATLLEKLSKHGGHIGPNLGLVELTIALHYVFASPKDKMVFDVSHQSYVHKMMTGRKDAFLNADHYDEVSGYSNPHESEHDFFTIGHTSTSISLACGLAKGRDLKGSNENIIAVIGDGSLSGGEAFEGLNNAAEAGTNMIIIVNDNDMSIAENHGGLYQNLKELRESEGKASCNFFRAMGLDYVFVKDGHDIKSLVEALESVKDTDHPVVVHVHTIKGRGFKPAEVNREKFHAGPPFDLETGEYLFGGTGVEDYTEFTAKYLIDAMKKDSDVIAITSGTPGVFGFNSERRIAAGLQFVDVGIAEEHAVALASGIAANGGKPVYGVYSTFIQRTYDQLSQDLCINNNAAVILVNYASVYGMNDVTHLGFFDIPMMSNIPNLVYLAPTNKEEYKAMLDWSIAQNEHPVAIRVPAVDIISTGKEDTTDYSILNKYELTKSGSKVAIVALGDFYQLGENVVEALKNDSNIEASLINPKFITGLDQELLEKLKENHEIVVTLEDGILEGGFGEKIARFYGSSDIKVLNYGIAKSFPDRYVAEELMKENRLTKEQIVEDINKCLK